MAEFGFTEAYRTQEFVVEIDGVQSPAITKVTGLSEGEVEPIDQPDAGANITHKISSGMIKYGDVTLERNLDGTKADDDFTAWFEDMFKLDGKGTGSQLRKDVSVVINQFGKEVLRFICEGAWIKSSKFSDLDAATPALMKQTIILAVERMYRV